MKQKREELNQREKAFDTSRVFTSFEEIVKIFLIICISFQISRHVASLIWGLMTNPSVINLILNHDERILTYPTYLKTCKEDPNLSPIEMAATYRLH